MYCFELDVNERGLDKEGQVFGLAMQKLLESAHAFHDVLRRRRHEDRFPAAYLLSSFGFRETRRDVFRCRVLSTRGFRESPE
jgi:hypothetical protein